MSEEELKGITPEEIAKAEAEDQVNYFTRMVNSINYDLRNGKRVLNYGFFLQPDVDWERLKKIYWEAGWKVTKIRYLGFLWRQLKFEELPSEDKK